MKPYSIALAANQVLDVQVGGEFFLLDASPQPVSFEFFGAGNMRRDETLESAVPGDWVRPKAGFAWVKITNGAVAQTVRFYVARGEVGRFRVQGEVTVIDGEYRRSMSGVTYVGFATVAAVAANRSAAQLWNPAGSGRRAVVRQLITSFPTAGALAVLGRHNAALPTLGAAPRAMKVDLGATSVMEVRSDNSVPALPGTNLMLFSINAGLGYSLRLVHPLIVPPGWSCTLTCDTVNLRNDTSFEFFEEPDV